MHFGPLPAKGRPRGCWKLDGPSEAPLTLVVLSLGMLLAGARCGLRGLSQLGSLGMSWLVVSAASPRVPLAAELAALGAISTFRR